MGETSSRKTSDGLRISRFVSAALDVARRRIDFDEYGSDARAIAALRRRCPERAAAACRTKLAQALELHQAAVRIATNRANLPDSHTTLAHALEQTSPGWPKGAYREVADWVWYWHVVR